MCGIAGLATARATASIDTVDSVRRMVARMQPRGPDAEGVWVDTGVVLGHRRLAILDLDSRANQPMQSADGRYAIVFNGEIYNHRELRRACSRERTVAFRTQSDTEVLLALYAREGSAMLHRLRGMFAIGIWDNRTRELLLARDAYGIKPLYYSQVAEGLVFASQVKALVASGLTSTDCETAGLVGFCLWGSVPEPWTVVRNVFALPAGHVLRVRNGIASRPICWHDVGEAWRQDGQPLCPSDLGDLVQATVADSVCAHLVSDVPVSVFLSGGIDSSAVAGLASTSVGRIEAITVGFEELAGGEDDERSAAATVAAHFNVQHAIRMVTRAEFLADVPHIIDAMDQPSIDGVNTWFASKAAAERGFKVVLSGVGGDELFCGYASFHQVPRVASIARVLGCVPGMRAVCALACASLARRYARPKIAGIPGLVNSLEGVYFLRRALFLPQELPAVLGIDMAHDGMRRLQGFLPQLTGNVPRDAAAVGLLESTFYLRNQLLRDSDWASMAHSIELRTPLVDTTVLGTLAPYVADFSRGAGKRMLARAPSRPVPHAIVSRRKQGFSVPMAQWLSQSEIPTGSALAADDRQPWARRWARVILQSVSGKQAAYAGLSSHV